MIIDEWASHVLSTRFNVLDAGVIAHAKNRIIDVVGCMIGGANAPGCSMLVDLVKQWGGRKEATVAVYGLRAPAHNVAMVNCVMARSFDFGPVISYVENKLVITHISESTVPTALTIAEWKNASGEELITALVLGDDITTRLLAASDNRLPGGWEYTGIANAFGTTAIAGRLLGLKASQMVNAFGIALNQMGGTMQNLYEGAQTFKLPQGLAARAGIFSAELANKGFVGVQDPLLGKYGYFALYSPAFNPGILTRELGNRFYSDSTFKMYPCCGASHPTIDCILNLVRDHNIRPEDLDEFTVNVTPAHLSQPLGQPFKIGDFPQGNAAFNLSYIAASTLIRQGVKPEHFTEPFVRDPAVMSLSRKINLTGTIPNEKHVTSAEVRVRLKDGTVFQTRVDAPKGHPDNPLTKSEIEQKFMDNVAFSQSISTRKAKTALDMINNLEKIKDINSLVPLLLV